MSFFIGAVVVAVILFALYRFSPYFKRRTDEFGSKIDKHTDNDGDGPFR